MNIRQIIYTCSLCNYFDSNQSKCMSSNKETYPQNSTDAMACKSEGLFVRNINVQYSYYNYVEQPTFSSEPLEDLSRLPKDKNGIPLFVFTKRGVERAVPAYPGLELVSHHLFGVKKEFTFQGQRELIYDIGVNLAGKVCEGLGIKLVVLDNERGIQGKEELRKPYLVYGR